MVPEFELLSSLIIIVGSALLLGLVFVRFRLPMVVGYLIAGLFIGPSGFNLIRDTTIIEILAPVGVVLLLFLIGLELNPLQLRRIALPVLILASTETLVSLVGGVMLGLLINLNFLDAVFFGAILSVSSTAIVGKILFDTGRLGEEDGRMLIGVLILEDILAVFFLFSLSSLSVAGYVPAFDVFLLVLKGLGLLFLITVFGIGVGPRLISFIARYEVETGELGFLLSLGLGIFFAAVASALGFSPAIGAFLVGLTIGGRHSKYLSTHITPIKDLFIIIFFVSMGILINFNSILILGLITLPIIAFSVLSKFLGMWLGSMVIGMKERAASMGFSMIPRGEFSLIIAKTGMDLGVVSPTLFSIAGAVALATSVIGPLGLKFGSKTETYPTPTPPLSSGDILSPGMLFPPTPQPL